MKNLIILIFLFLFVGQLYAQPPHDAKRDYHWIGGYWPAPDSGYLLNHFDFNSDSLQIYHDPEESMVMEIFRTSAVLSDIDGEPCFYSNGCSIARPYDAYLPGGDAMNEDDNEVYDLTCVSAGSGQGYPYQIYALPLPGNNDKFYLFHHAGFLDWDSDLQGYMYQLRLTEISQDLNGELYVPFRDSVIIVDTLHSQHLAACRHANGRDWWFLTTESGTNCFYKLLLTPNGIEEITTQCLGLPLQFIETSTGNLAFSPNGHFLARSSRDSELSIYRFDRCNGDISQPVNIDLPENQDIEINASFSPSNRFLYVSIIDQLLQLDLELDTSLWQSSIQLIGTTETLQRGFSRHTLGPDGKIYITVPGGDFKLHEIEFPDQSGQNCGLSLEKYHYDIPLRSSFPYYPNYRLGPEIGTECDSLPPFAYFEYLQNDIAYEFEDRSGSHPTSWFWEFGDGMTSSEQHPTHSYDAVGSYQVCLASGNQNGTDTYCDFLDIQIVNVEMVEESKDIQIFPNPAWDVLQIVFDGQDHAQLSFFNPLGQRLKEIVLHSNETQSVDVSGWPSGVYTWLLEDSNRGEQVGKVVVYSK